MVLNPWKVQNISEFVYFCCPECVFRSKEDSSFQAHALQNHVLSRTFFHGTDESETEIKKENDTKHETNGVHEFDNFKSEGKRNKTESTFNS